jgi:hypothetical protein
MAIRIDSFCYECLLRRHVATARSLGTEEQATQFAQRLLRACLDAPEDTPSPVIGTVVSDLLLEMYGLPLDRFRQEKEDSNRFVMERMEDIRRKVTGAEDPVFGGLQMAILGNYLDYGALQGQISFDKLEQMMEEVIYKPSSFGTGSSDMGDVSSVMPAVHPYVGGSAGTSHGVDYRIVDVNAACVDMVKLHAVALELLLGNEAARAKAIIAAHTPLFASIEEYLHFADSFFLDREVVRYDDKGNVILNLGEEEL